MSDEAPVKQRKSYPNRAKRGIPGDILTTLSPASGAVPQLKKEKKARLQETLRNNLFDRIADIAIEQRAEWFETICREIGAGSTIEEATRKHGLTREAFNDLADSDPALYSRYVNSLGRRAQAYAEEIISLADDVPRSASMAEIKRAELRVKSRQFVVERLIDVYKAKREVQVNTTVALTDEQVDERLSQLLGKAMNQHIIDEARTVDL